MLYERCMMETVQMIFGPLSALCCHPPNAYLQICNGANMEVGFLLYGPPGCGKTLIAKAVANAAGANFIHIKGPELLNKYAGGDELVVRSIFSNARMCAPCELFFSEVDAFTTMPGEGGRVERAIDLLVRELDGADMQQGIYVIAATNWLEVMDHAVLRRGKFDRILYAPLPTAEERGLILKSLARKKPLAADVDLNAFGRKESCHNLTGADLSDLMEEAAVATSEEKVKALDSDRSYAGPSVIEASHLGKALAKIAPSPSVSEEAEDETPENDNSSLLRAYADEGFRMRRLITLSVTW